MIENWFSTPIWYFYDTKFDDTIEAQFIEYMNKYRENNYNGAIRSNVNCYQSDDIITSYPCNYIDEFLQETVLVELQQSINTITNLSINSMWFNENGKGGLNKNHIHPHTDLSGVFYVSTPEECGNIVFYNPLTESIMSRCNREENVHYTPERGKLIIFPSWLYHSVRPNKSDGIRRSIAFNLTVS